MTQDEEKMVTPESVAEENERGLDIEEALSLVEEKRYAAL